MRTSIVRARLFSAIVALAIVACAPASDAQNAAQSSIIAEAPWAAATNPGATVAAGYVTLRNTGAAADRLVSATSPRALRVELHEMSMANGVMRMRPVQGITVDAGGAVTLQPGGLHIMFLDIDGQFQDAQRVPVTLRFERSGALEVEFVVRPRGRSRHEH